MVSYTENGEELVALAYLRLSSPMGFSETGGRVLPRERVEELIAETVRRGFWEAWKFSSYVVAVEGCSTVCQYFVASRGASAVNVSHEALLAMAERLVSEIGRYVKLPCKDRDYMCYAYAIDRFKRVLEAERNAARIDMMTEVVSEMFSVPDSVMSKCPTWRLG